MKWAIFVIVVQLLVLKFRKSFHFVLSVCEKNCTFAANFLEPTYAQK